MNKFDKYLKTYEGKCLLEKHSLEEEGVWYVFGEDPNADFHGPHHQPFLGHFEGTLEDAIGFFVRIEGFWTWGGGGSFKKMKEPKFSENKESGRDAEIRQKIEALYAKIDKLKKELQSD